MWPKVTIAITAYNQKDYLREAIEGCLDQDYPNLEVLVIDDCSTDGTDKMVQDYINKIRYVRNEVNIGPGNNSHNILYNLINSPYAISFNHDDYLIKRDYVSTAINMFKNNPNLSIIWANCKIKDEATGQFSATNFNNKEIMSGIEYFKNYETKGYPHICGQLTTIYDVNKLRKAGYGKERTKSKDTFACLKLMLQGDIGFIKDCVAVYRVHKKSLSFNMDSEYDMSTIEEFEKLKMEVLMQKRASNEEMEIWLNNRIRAYILWRFSTLWNNNDKKGALNLMYKIHNKYPKAYEIIVNEL